MFDQFWKFTNQFVPFSPKEKERIKAAVTIRDVPKNYILIDVGQTAKETYFINKGLLRFYYLTDEGNEVTGFIFQENMFAGSTAYQELHPGLEGRIPQHILASYMGITPVSLSRIRRRISEGK